MTMRLICLGEDKTFPIVDPTTGTYLIRVILSHQSNKSYYFLIKRVTKGYYSIEAMYSYLRDKVILDPDNRSNCMKTLQDVIRFMEVRFKSSSVTIIQFDNDEELFEYIESDYINSIPGVFWHENY